MLAEIRRLARHHIHCGDVMAAQAVLSAEPSLEHEPEILALKAQLAMRGGDAAAARDFLVRAVTREPRNVEACMTLAKLEVQEGVIAGALAHLERIADAAGAEPAFQKLKARALLAQGDGRGAGELLAAAFRSNPTDAATGRKAVYLLAEAGAGLAASALAGEVLAAHPGDHDLFRARIEFLIASGGADDLAAEGRQLARQSADAGLRIARRLLDLDDVLGAASVFSAIPPDLRAEPPADNVAEGIGKRLIAAAAEAERQDDHAGVLTALATAAVFLPDDSALRKSYERGFRNQYSAGADALREGRFSDALGFLERALDFDPGHEMALDLLARAAVGAGNHEAAIGALRRLAARRPDDAALLRKLARVCEASGNLIAALDAERRLAALGDPEAANRASRLVTAIAREARQGLDRGDLADAYDALVALRSVEADHPQTADLVQRFTARQLRRAHEARRARLHAEVAAAAERILALNPDHTRALALLASARHGLRDFAAAADLFRRVACAEPDNEAAWIGLARAEHRAGHPDAARAAAMEVRRLVPGDPTALAILGALATEAATIAQDTAAAVDLRLGETVIPSIDAVAPVVDKPKRKGGRRKRKA